MSVKPFESWVESVSAGVLEGLRRGRAPWLPGMAVMGPMPFDPASSDGRSKVFGALNAVWLSTQALEKGLVDPRWVTFDEASKLGGRVRRGEKAIQVSQLRTQAERVGVGADGMEVLKSVPVTRPEFVVAHVFNGAQVDGLKPLPVERPVMVPEKLLEKLVVRMGLAGAGQSAVLGLEDVVEAAAGSLPKVSAAEKSLSDSLAMWMLARRLDLALPDVGQAGEVEKWVKMIEGEPRVLSVAAKSAAVMLQQVMPHVVAIEKEARMALDQQAAQQPSGQREAAAKEKMRFVSAGAGDGRVFLWTKSQEDRERVKALGARWDKDVKLWYVPAGRPAAAFEPWLAQGVAACGINPSEVKLAFEDACRELGLDVRDGIVADSDKWMRTAISGQSAKKKDGAYKLSLIGKPRGYIKNFHTGKDLAWSFDMPQLSDEQRALLEKQGREIREAQAKAQAQAYKLRAEALVTEFVSAREDGAEQHPYLQRKGVGAYGVRLNEWNELVIPLRDVGGKLWSMQWIKAAEKGSKLLAPGGKAAGMFHLVGADGVEDLKAFPAVLYAEGYATAASLHEATGLPVAMTVSAGNIEPVVAAIKKAVPEIKHVIAADNDLWFPERVREAMRDKGLKLEGDGLVLPVESGPGCVRKPLLEGCHFDGRWHAVEGGRYCVTPERVNGAVVALSGAVENAAGVQSPVMLRNTGVTKAREAVARHGAAMVVPVFDESVAGRPTDFNDLAVERGRETVRSQVMNQLARVPEIAGWLRGKGMGTQPVGLVR